MASHHCRGEQLWIPGVSALVLHSSSVCLCCRQAWSHLLQCHWHLHKGLLIWAQSIWSSQTSLSIFSCAGRTQTRNLLLFKETLGFVGSKHVPAAPVPSSFLLHLGVAHRVQGSGPGFTHSEWILLVLAVPFPPLWHCHADSAGCCSLSCSPGSGQILGGNDWDLLIENHFLLPFPPQIN